MSSSHYFSLYDSFLLSREQSNHSRLAEELYYRAHLRSGEYLGILFIPLGHHGRPHAAREVHLFTKVLQGAIVIMVGVIHLGELAEGIGFYLEVIHICS